MPPNPPKRTIPISTGKKLQRKLDSTGELTPSESAIYRLYEEESRAISWHYVKYGGEQPPPMLKRTISDWRDE